MPLSLKYCLSVTRRAAAAATIAALYHGTGFELVLGYSWEVQRKTRQKMSPQAQKDAIQTAYTRSAEVGVASLNASETAEFLIARLRQNQLN